MPATNYEAQVYLDHNWRGVAHTFPGTNYLGLFTGTPGYDGSGPEVAVAGYARQTLALSVVSGRSLSNTNLVTIPSPSVDVGEITHVGVFDALSGGNLRLFEVLSPPLLLVAGGSLQFDPGVLVFQVLG